MMNSPQQGAGPRLRRRRRLNIGAIKANVVFVVGLITAMVGGLTGLGTQVAYAPMLSWMLGFNAEKAQATAMRFAAIAAATAVIGALMAGATPPSYVLRGLLLFVGAVIGAVVAAPFAVRLQTPSGRRSTQTLGVGLMLAVIVQCARLGRFDLPYVAQWNTPLLLGLLGVGVGFATQLLSLPSGALLVPALYFLAGFPPVHAVALALLVVALASLLPAISYSRTGLADERYLLPTTLAAAIGGAIGGRLLPMDTTLIRYKVLIMATAAIAMFFCGRELARLANTSTAPPQDQS